MRSLERAAEGLSDEMKAKVTEAKSPEELLELAREAGVELTEDELEAVAGGLWSESENTCASYGNDTYRNS